MAKRKTNAEKKKTPAGTKKSTTKKSTTKKSTTKKSTTKKSASKKSASKKPASKKTASKKTASKKTATKKAGPKKASRKRRPAAPAGEARASRRGTRPEPPPQPPRREAAARRTPTPEAPRRAPAERRLAWSYGLDRVRALPVDPNRLFVYWEVTDPAIEAAREKLGAKEAEAQVALRLYDTTGRLFDGTNAHSHRDQPVERSARQWFFDVGRPGSEFFVELGVRTEDGRFQKVARSGRAAFPRLAASERRPAEWMTVLTRGADEGEPMEPSAFAHPAPGAFGATGAEARSDAPVRVEERYAGSPRHAALDRGEHVAYGPWRVDMYGFEGEREISGRWLIYRSWVVAEGRFAVPGAPYLVPGSSERLGASERRFVAASEMRLGGASQRLRPGASALRLEGGSERRLGGASERTASRGAYPRIEDDRATDAD